MPAARRRAVETEQAHQGRIEAQFRAWGAELDKLKAKVDKEIAEAKKAYYDHIEALRDDIEAQLRKWGPEIEGLKAKAGETEAEARKIIQELRDRVQAELKQLGPEIADLKSKASRAEVEARKAIEELKARQNALKAKLHELRDAGDAAWGDIKVGMGKAWEDLKPALKSAIAKFR